MADEKTAEAVCTERLGDISSLLDQIGQELTTRFQPIAEAEVDWSDAADLHRVRDGLIETLRGLTSFSRQEIENTLEEIRG